MRGVTRVFKAEDAAVLEKLPTMLTTVMFSLTPSMPGIRQQMPRTIILIGTPACEAS